MFFYLHGQQAHTITGVWRGIEDTFSSPEGSCNPVECSFTWTFGGDSSFIFLDQSEGIPECDTGMDGIVGQYDITDEQPDGSFRLILAVPDFDGFIFCVNGRIDGKRFTYSAFDDIMGNVECLDNVAFEASCSASGETDVWHGQCISGPCLENSAFSVPSMLMPLVVMTFASLVV